MILTPPIFNALTSSVLVSCQQYFTLARSYLVRVDEIRLNYIRDLFVEAGFGGIDAENRARLLHHYEMSDPAFFVPRDDETETRLVAERLQLLLRPNKDKAVINM